MVFVPIGSSGERNLGSPLGRALSRCTYQSYSHHGTPPLKKQTPKPSCFFIFSQKNTNKYQLFHWLPNICYFLNFISFHFSILITNVTNEKRKVKIFLIKMLKDIHILCWISSLFLSLPSPFPHLFFIHPLRDVSSYRLHDAFKKFYLNKLSFLPSFKTILNGNLSHIEDLRYERNYHRLPNSLPLQINLLSILN